MFAENEIKGEERKDNSDQASNTNGASDYELNQRIIKHIEFFFGEANLSRNKVIREQAKLDNGWIPMSTMLEFQQLAALSSKPDVIANAVKSSLLVEVDTTGTEVKLRRSPEMPLPKLNAKRRKAITSRTIYCKRFPLDYKMDAVMAIIYPHGTPENIHMRKYIDTLTQKYMFKGSILVTFKTPKEAKAFLKKEDVKIGDTVLEKMWQCDYNKMKKKKKKLENKGKNDDVPKEEGNVKQTDFIKGATIHLSGNLVGVRGEHIQKALFEFGVVPASINFVKGQAFIRLPEENSAKAAVEKMTDELTVKDSKMTLRVLEGTEEEEYLKHAIEDKRKYMEMFKNAKEAKKVKQAKCQN